MYAIPPPSTLPSSSAPFSSFGKIFLCFAPRFGALLESFTQRVSWFGRVGEGGGENEPLFLSPPVKLSWFLEVLELITVFCTCLVGFPPIYTQLSNPTLNESLAFLVNVFWILGKANTTPKKKNHTAPFFRRNFSAFFITAIDSMYAMRMAILWVFSVTCTYADCCRKHRKIGDYSVNRSVLHNINAGI